MKLVRRLRGYDRTTDDLAVEYEIPAALDARLPALVGTAADAPDWEGITELNDTQAARFGAALGVSLDLTRCSFVLDCFASWEDIQAVRGRRKPRRLSRAVFGSDYHTVPPKQPGDAA